MGCETLSDYNDNETSTGPESPTRHSSYVPGNRIVQWFRGKSVFVTGATGFMGKILLEKLLRSCPGLEKIYFLIRLRSQDKSLEDRVDLLLAEDIFDKVRHHAHQKLYPVAGDMEHIGLGLSDDDRHLLEEKVHVVFHCAATVRFQDPIKKCVLINVKGTQQILNLGRKMKNLQAFIHVSTAYCNSERLQTEEKFYKQRFHPEHVMQLCDWVDDDIAEQLQPVLMGRKPNTYVFTKALAEVLVQEATDLPIAVVRPSIVVGAFKEPISGWTDNMNGPNALFIGVGKGILHTFRADPWKTTDMIPVDVVIAIMLAAAWKTGSAKRIPMLSPPIYHATSGVQNPVYWQDILDVGYVYMEEKPLLTAMWQPSFKYRKSRFMNDLVFELTLHIPAQILDFKNRMLGNKAKFLKTYDAFNKQKEVLEYFSSREFTFVPDRTVALLDELSVEEKSDFPCDIAEVDWKKFFYNYFHISRLRLVKNENLEGKPALQELALKRARRRKLMHRVFCALPYVFFGLFLLLTYQMFFAATPTSPQQSVC